MSCVYVVIVYVLRVSYTIDADTCILYSHAFTENRMKSEREHRTVT